MSKIEPGVDVNILGRKFRVACNENEKEELLRTVKYVDTRMKNIRDAGKVIGVERIAIMAALNIAHELLTSSTGDGFDIGETRRRIYESNQVIDKALTAQEALF